MPKTPRRRPSNDIAQFIAVRHLVSPSFPPCNASTGKRTSVRAHLALTRVQGLGFAPAHTHEGAKAQHASLVSGERRGLLYASTGVSALRVGDSQLQLDEKGRSKVRRGAERPSLARVQMLWGVER